MNFEAIDFEPKKAKEEVVQDFWRSEYIMSLFAKQEIQNEVHATESKIIFTLFSVV